MLATWEIVKEVQTELNRKSVFVQLTNADGNEHRLFEAAHVPLNMDPDKYVKAHPSTTVWKMWTQGKAITPETERSSKTRNPDGNAINNPDHEHTTDPIEAKKTILFDPATFAKLEITEQLEHLRAVLAGQVGG